MIKLPSLYLSLFLVSVLCSTAVGQSTLSNKIVITLTENGGQWKIEGKNTIQIVNRSAAEIGTFRLLLQPEANEPSSLPLRIGALEATRHFRILATDPAEMRIGLFPALKPGESIIVTIPFEAMITSTPRPWGSFISRIDGHVVILARHYYPQIKFSDGSGEPISAVTQSLSILVPDSLTIVAGGSGQARSKKSLDRDEYRISGQDAADMAFIAAGKMDEETLAEADCSIKHIRFRDHENEKTSLVKDIKQTIVYYGNVLGPPPRSEILLISHPELPARAMSYPGLIIYRPDLMDNHAMSHEIARQWFGFQSVKDGWLRRSLADYLAWKYDATRNNPGGSILKQESYWKSLWWNYRTMSPEEWMRLMTEILGNRIHYPKYNPGKTTTWESRAHEYSQYIVGSHALQLLEHSIGTDAMELLLRQYLLAETTGEVTIDTFIDLVRAVSSPSEAEKFRLALTTNIQPDIRILKVEEVEEGPHQWRTKISLAYNGDWVIPVDALIITARDSIRRTELRLKKNVELVITSTTRVEQVIIDPDNHLYDSNRFNNRWPRRISLHPIIGRPSWDVYSVYYRPRLFKDWRHDWRIGIRVSGGLGLNLMPILPALFQNNFDLDLTFSLETPQYNWGGRLAYRTPLSSIHLTYWEFVTDYEYPRNRQILSIVNYLGEPSYFFTSGKSYYQRLTTQIKRVEYTATDADGWWDRGIQYWLGEEYQRFFYSEKYRYVLQGFGLVGQSIQGRKKWNLSRFTLAADGEIHAWDRVIVRGHLESGFVWDPRRGNDLRYRLQYLPRIWKERKDFVPLFRGFVSQSEVWWDTVMGSGLSLGYESNLPIWPMVYADYTLVSNEQGSIFRRLDRIEDQSGEYFAAGIGIESQSLVEMGLYFPLWLSDPPEGEDHWGPRIIVQWGFYF